MNTPIDMTGVKYGGLTGVEFSHVSNRHHFWVFLCDCGRKKVVEKYHVTHGIAVSCGCWRKRRRGGITVEHAATYRSYRSMKSRCTNPAHIRFFDYGGRGIKICDRWAARNGFKHFLTDMGRRPRGKTLDRRDVNGPYSPDNCKWSTLSEQNLNRRPWGKQ